MSRAGRDTGHDTAESEPQPREGQLYWQLTQFMGQDFPEKLVGLETQTEILYKGLMVQGGVLKAVGHSDPFKVSHSGHLKTIESLWKIWALSSNRIRPPLQA